jgi:hypothetical protein
MVGMAHHANSQTEEGLLFELLFGIVTIDLPIDVPVILMGWHLLSTSSLMFVYYGRLNLVNCNQIPNLVCGWMGTQISR